MTVLIVGVLLLVATNVFAYFLTYKHSERESNSPRYWDHIGPLLDRQSTTSLIWEVLVLIISLIVIAVDGLVWLGNGNVAALGWATIAIAIVLSFITLRLWQFFLS